jgi:hypothetical protein
MRVRVVPILTLVVATALPLFAAELPKRVLDAFDRYHRATEAQMARTRSGGGFLWIDTLPESSRTRVYNRLKRGEVVTETLHTQENGKRLNVPDAIFLHSVGAVFIANGTVGQVQRILQDYDRHAEYFGPIVRRSKVLEHAGDEFLVFRQLYHRTIITYTYNMDFRVRYSRPKGGQLECRSFATRGAQVEDVGKPTEREEPVKGNPANQWRLNTYCRAEEREEGTYLEYETLFVAPELPWMIRVIGGPIVRGFPSDAATQILKATQKLSVAQF